MKVVIGSDGPGVYRLMRVYATDVCLINVTDAVRCVGKY